MRSLAWLLLVLVITPSTSTIVGGKTVQLKATCDGADCTQTVAWVSQSSRVATVTAGGMVTAMSMGSTTIMATSSGVIAGSVVTVK
jgi:hypothetical protein